MTTKTQPDPKDLSGREIVVTRVFDAPRERVFEAVADSKQVVQWWGPRGFSTTSETREFKAGGVWKHVMVGPDGARYPNLAKYQEVVRPERIVYSHGGAKENGGDGVRFTSTWTFKDLGNGKTEVVMRGVFDTAEGREHAIRAYGALEGAKQTLTRLGEHLAGEFVMTRLFDAPRDKAWRAWIEPERLNAWFGPKGMPVVKADMDLRVGGVYHYGLRTPDGGEMWGKWTFREIAAPERLVFVNSFSDAAGGITRHPMSPNWPRELLTTILFDDFGGKTLLTVKWLPLNASDLERKTFDDARPNMSGGWGGTLEKFAEYLAAGGGR